MLKAELVQQLPDLGAQQRVDADGRLIQNRQSRKVNQQLDAVREGIHRRGAQSIT